jgi:hypothetical protein
MSLPFVPDHASDSTRRSRPRRPGEHPLRPDVHPLRPGVHPLRPVDRPRRLAGDRGQTTAEYALVLLGAAAIAALLIAWASKSGAVGQLFDAVLSHVIGSVT